MPFFEFLREVQEACSGLSIGQTEIGLAERKEVVACYIWTMGKSIEVQNVYMEAQFKNHPSIARVINYHIFHNKVPLKTYNKSIGDLKKNIRDLFSWKGAVSRQLSKLENSSRN